MAPRIGKFTPEARDLVIDAVASGATVAQAATVVGLGVQTVKGWITRGNKESGTPYAEFVAAIEFARSSAPRRTGGEEELVSLLWVAARGGSVQAIRLLLERQKREGKGGDGNSDEAQGDPLAEADELAQRRLGRA